MSSPKPVPAPADSLDFGVAWHYGDPFAEQVALESGAALVDLSHHAVIQVTGSDRLRWLNDLTTQDLKHLAPGDSALTLILDPHGRVESELHLIHGADQTWLIVEPYQAEAVLKYLDSMRFMLDVAVADVTDQLAVVGSGESTPRASSPTWLIPAEYRGEPVEYVRNGGKYVPERPAVLQRSEFIVPRLELPATLEAAPAPAGTWAWEALRIAAGVPRIEVDTDNRTIPHEVGWIGTAVHLVKGCYRGQETVARVHNLGRPPRRLVLLHLDGAADLRTRPGDPVQYEDAVVGTIGSVAQHHELGPIALATVKRSVPIDADLRVGADGEATPAAARQQSIVVA